MMVAQYIDIINKIMKKTIRNLSLKHLKAKDHQTIYRPSGKKPIPSKKSSVPYDNGFIVTKRAKIYSKEKTNEN